MEKDISRIVDIVHDIQLAALGDVGPYDEREIYLADINKRIRGIEKRAYFAKERACQST